MTVNNLTLKICFSAAKPDNLKAKWKRFRDGENSSSLSELLEPLVHLLEVLRDLLGVLVEHVLRLLQHPRARAQARGELLLHAVHLRQGRAEFQGCNRVCQVRLLLMIIDHWL